MSTSKGAAGKSFHHGQLRKALIEAAVVVLERGGPAGISLREVARLAGVSHNAPYRHFPTREALLAAVAEHGFGLLRSEFHAAQAAAHENQVVAIGNAYLSFALHHPNLFQLMFGSQIEWQAYPALGQAAEEAFGMLQAAIVAEGSSLPREAAIGAWALVHGLAHLTVDGRLAADLRDDAADGQLLERIAKVFGLRSPLADR